MNIFDISHVIVTDRIFNSKIELLNFLSNELLKFNIISDKNEVAKAYLEREQQFKRDVNKFENEKKIWKDNQENFIKSMQTENEILKEELKFIKEFKMIRPQAKMMSEKDLIFDTLEKVKKLTYKE